MKQPQKLNLENIRFYEYRGNYYASVTSFLKTLAKGDNYERWLGNAKSYKDAMAYRDYKRDIGLLTHHRLTKIVKTLDIKNYKLHTGYLRSFLRFAAIFKPVPIYQEKIILNLKDGYAGTLDFFGWISNPNDGRRILCLIDWKTSNYIDRANLLQAACYAEPIARLKRYKQPIYLVIVRLRPNGSFSPKADIILAEPKERTSIFKTAMHIKDTFEWLHRDDEINPLELRTATLPVTHTDIIIYKNKRRKQTKIKI
jgi:hypothetical protein